MDTVVSLIDAPDNLSKWMIGLRSFEHISGDAGQAGARSKKHFKIRKREFDMIETVTVRNLPDEFSAAYETKGGANSVTNRFSAIDGNTTRWISENEFHFQGILMKLMAFFMPGAFRKQTMNYLKAFKKFAESEQSVKPEETNA